jgi:hypothetical protein
MGDPTRFDAPLAAYDETARALLDAFGAGDAGAESRFKWEHPRFRDQPLSAVKGAPMDLDDARLVVAHENSFDTWPDLKRFAEAAASDGAVRRFETAVDVVIAGDVEALRLALRDDPQLVRARSTRRHHATLLHYLGANGVEGGRQKTPANAVEIMKILLDADADPDALADLYENKCTTMSMVVSSAHPARAGLQAALAETLLDYGAAVDGRGTNWQSALMTALQFGYLDTARRLAARGAPTATLPAAAGLGLAEDVARLLPTADALARHQALALAAQLGHPEVVAQLLDAGEDPNRQNPDGFHSHSTPLHQAVAAGHLDVVRLLVERGARVDIQDTIFHGTALGWADHCQRPAIAEYLRGRQAP